MKNQFLSLMIVFLMGYFSGNVLKEIRPAAYNVINKIEALVVSNKIAKDLPNSNYTLVSNDQFALINFTNYNYYDSKSIKVINNNPLTEELLYNTERLFKYVTSKLATSRGSPRDIFNNTS